MLLSEITSEKMEEEEKEEEENEEEEEEEALGKAKKAIVCGG